ncbi:hypothetical protein ACSSV1_003633 [Labrenzia sp. MBR-25]
MGGVLKKTSTSKEQCLSQIDEYNLSIRPELPSSCNADFKKVADFIFELAEVFNLHPENDYAAYAKKYILGQSNEPFANPNLNKEFYDFTKESTLIQVVQYQISDWNYLSNSIVYEDTKQTILFNMNANKFNPREFIGLLFHYLLDFFAKERSVTVLNEGVTEERSYPVSVKEDGKLDRAALAPIFEGTLEHEFLANSLRWVMEQEKLSVRKVATKSGSSPSVIQTVLNGKAKLETGQKILEALGYGLSASLHKLEP